MMRTAMLAAALLAAACASSPSWAQDATPPPASPAPSETFSLEDLDLGREGARAPPRGQRSESLDYQLRAIAIEHIEANGCWRSPENARPSTPIRITVRFALDETGALQGRVRVIEPAGFAFDAKTGRAIDNAIRAVRRCSPFPFARHPVAADHYEEWRERSCDF